MPREHLSPTPNQVANEVAPSPVTVYTPQTLLDAALARIEPDGSVLFDRDTPEQFRQSSHPPAPSDRWDDTVWAYKALEIATVLYQRLRPSPNPDYALSSFARYLTAFRHDPGLLAAAVSLIEIKDGHPSPPQNATGRLQWREDLARFRTK